MPDAIDRLHHAVQQSRSQDLSRSRTARLLASGVTKMSKKVIEEAAEVGLDAVAGNRAGVVAESADLAYNLVVLWASLGITPEEVWAEMERRERLYGLAEKLAKADAPVLPTGRVLLAEGEPVWD